MSVYKPSIAIAGLNGSLGPSLLKAFSEASGSISLPIRALTRSNKDASTKIIDYVAVNYNSTTDLQAALSGVDVLVDVLNGPGIDVAHKALIDAAAANGVKVFFPSKFGADYRRDHIYNHPSYALNREVTAYAESHIPKVVRVYLGLFSEAISTYIIPSSDDIIQGIGSGNENLSTTSTLDVARSVVQLSLLDLSHIPEHVYLSGSTLTYNSAAEALRKRVQLTSIPDARIRFKDILGNVGHSNVSAPSYVYMLRCFVGEGWFDYSKNNHNELVNPGESRWKWTQWESAYPTT